MRHRPAYNARMTWTEIIILAVLIPASLMFCHLTGWPPSFRTRRRW
jgi:hypothetical protein